jgi:hypothetical protein
VGNREYSNELAVPIQRQAVLNHRTPDPGDFPVAELLELHPFIPDNIPLIESFPVKWVATRSPSATWLKMESMLSWINENIDLS